jgi:hypothetical protein
MRLRAHVPSVEAERIRILQLDRGIRAGIEGRRAFSTAEWEGLSDMGYTGDTKVRLFISCYLEGITGSRYPMVWNVLDSEDRG